MIAPIGQLTKFRRPQPLMNIDTPAGDGDTTIRVMKIIVVGDPGTGKTCLIRKFVKDAFSDFYKTTIGVDFASKRVPWNDHTVADVQLWDIAGQERFGKMTGVYYREAVGAIVVFDVTRDSTFDVCATWKADIDEKVKTADLEPVPTILLGNKIDLFTKLDTWEQRRIEIEQYVKDNHYLAFFEVSAKTGINLTESMMHMVDHILSNNILSESDRANDPKLEPADKTAGDGACC